MDEEEQITQEPSPKSTRPVKGRPVLGQCLRVRTPPWIFAQLEALRELHGPGTALAAVHRDVLIAGLISLKAEGVGGKGFDPGLALIEAKRRGEPTGLLVP